MEGLVLFWVCCGLIASIVGAKKGEGVIGFIVGFVFGPIGLLLVIASKGKDGWRCRFCKEGVHKDATVCKHCGSSLAAVT